MSEIAFIIDHLQSDVNHHLRIGLAEVKKEGYGYTFTDKKTFIKAAIEKLISSSLEREAINFLFKEETLYLKSLGKSFTENTPINFFNVRCSQSQQLLKLLAATGKVFFKGKQLILDLYGTNDFYFSLKQSDGHFIVEGRIKSSQDDISIKDCDFVCPGAPHWYIKGISLKLLSTDIEWKHLKRAYIDTTWTLKDHEKHDFLSEFEEIDGGKPPKIVLKDNDDTFHAKVEPTPILILKDRTGAFADLWFDYGNQRRCHFHDPIKQNFKRNIEAEERFEKDLLETDFIRKTVGQTHYYCPLEKVNKSLTFLLEVGWQLIDHLNNKVVLQDTLQLSMHDSAKGIVIKGKANYESYEVSAVKVLGAFNRKERFISLSPGVSGLIPEKWDNIALDTLSDGEIVGDEIKLKKHQLGNLSDLWDSKNISLDTTLTNLKERLQKFSGVEHTKPGKEFLGTLRPYQQEGLNWLNFLYEYGFHGLLADDMGLGKTVQVLAFLSQLPLEKPILIIMPTSLIFNWQAEVHKFLPNMNVYAHHGPQRLRESDELEKQQLILTSYTILRQDLPLFTKIDYQCVIIDEAQAIKNAQTQTAEAICALSAQFRLSITGTPIENHLGELWSQFRFLIPELFGTEANFAAETQAASLDSRYLQRIRKKVKPFFLRRTKNEVAKDLPEKIEQTVFVEMDSHQREIYDTFLSNVKGNLLQKVRANGLGKHRIEVLEAILRLRQICCHPLLVSSILDNEKFMPSSAKMEILLQDIETALDEDKKVLIYSQFTSMLQVLAKSFKEREWHFCYLDGTTKDREGIVKEFQEDADKKLFLISLKAGGVGLNLTAADYVFLYDPWWNNAVENQAIDRAHRIGRHDTVIAKRYIAVESIEEKMMKLKQHKRTLVEDLLEATGENPQLSEEDFYFLLS